MWEAILVTLNVITVFRVSCGCYEDGFYVYGKYFGKYNKKKIMNIIHSDEFNKKIFERKNSIYGEDAKDKSSWANEVFVPGYNVCISDIDFMKYPEI